MRPPLFLAMNLALLRLALLRLALTAALMPLAAQAKEARCVIRQDGVVAYSGACHVRVEKGGGFSIRRHDAQPILPRITDLSVSIVSTGVADVRGLTTDGINSRWGTAVRSRVNPACWTGSDFEICAENR